MTLKNRVQLDFSAFGFALLLLARLAEHVQIDRFLGQLQQAIVVVHEADVIGLEEGVIKVIGAFRRPGFQCDHELKALVGLPGCVASVVEALYFIEPQHLTHQFNPA